MIIGMDWLECYNPIKVDWLNKRIIINHECKAVHLHGLQPTIPEFSLVEVFFMQDSVQEENSSCFVHTELPVPVQQPL
jgi:hypothetical protein